MEVIDFKKCMWKLWVKFYGEQNEDCSLGESTLDSSDKLLHRGSGEGQHRCDFGEGEVCSIKHIIFAEGFCKIRESF